MDDPETQAAQVAPSRRSASRSATSARLSQHGTPGMIPGRARKHGAPPMSPWTPLMPLWLPCMRCGSRSCEIRASDDARAAASTSCLPGHGGQLFSPRGRHEAGSGQPEDEPWGRTPYWAVWRAYQRGLVLTVTRLVGGGWQATVEGPGVTERAPMPFRTRKRAQAWADNRAGDAS